MNPPPLPQRERAAYAPQHPQPSPHKPGLAWGITSLVVAGLGVVPLIIYGISCLAVLEAPYHSNFFLPLVMGLLGIFVHTLGLIAGIVAVSGRSGVSGGLGLLGNGIILAIVLIAGFITILL